MCFDFDARPPKLPADLHCRPSRAAPVPRSSRSRPRTLPVWRRVRRVAGRPRSSRDRPARRPRAVPLLRRTGRALRRRGPPRHRHRLLRARGRIGTPRRGLRLHGPPPGDDPRAGSGRHCGGPGCPAGPDGRTVVRDARLLLRRRPVVARRHQPGARPRCGDRLLRDPRSDPHRLPVRDAGPARSRPRDALHPWSDCSAGQTHSSPPTTSRRSTAPSTRRASNTRSSRTPAPRTRSSIARQKSTPTPRRMPGDACSDSSTRSARRVNLYVDINGR
jgi:hypothetical protein